MHEMQAPALAGTALNRSVSRRVTSSKSVGSGSLSNARRLRSSNSIDHPGSGTRGLWAWVPLLVRSCLPHGWTGNWGGAALPILSAPADRWLSIDRNVREQDQMDKGLRSLDGGLAGDGGYALGGGGFGVKRTITETFRSGDHREIAMLANSALGPIRRNHREILCANRNTSVFKPNLNRPRD